MSALATFWRSRRVFLTGHTGFKGAWLTLLLDRLGAEVCGFSLEAPVSEPSMFATLRLHELCDDRRGDVRDLATLRRELLAFAPDVVIHMAAQPIVRAGVRDPVETLEINVMGVAKLLEAARAAPSLGAVVIVTSDKCYDNRERVWPYRENEAMGGSDPYSASKGAAELVTAAWAKTFFRGGGPAVVSVRAGNVIGGGDWAADRLLPDLVRAAASGEPVHIRSPRAVRPWQHVLDPLHGYLLAAQAALEGRAARPFDAWNFGPEPGEEFTVREVVDVFRTHWRGDLPVAFAEAEHDAAARKEEAGLLRVDSTKAKVELGWRPTRDNAAAVETAATWYAAHREHPDVGEMRALTASQMNCLSASDAVYEED